MSEHINGCTGKIRYKDGKAAMGSSQWNADRYCSYPPLRPYLCEACQGWHLTSDRTQRGVVSESAIKEMAQAKPELKLEKTTKIRAKAVARGYKPAILVF